MMAHTAERFDAGADAWAAYNQTPLGRIRSEVTWHNLSPHLPELITPEQPPRVLEAGGGTGELALRLVRAGYRVWLLDYAETMLARAQEAAKSLPDRVRARLTFYPLDIDDAPQAFVPQFFDAITCHTLIEYLPDPQSTLATLTGLLSDGGRLSLSFVNRHAQVLRQVWSRADPAGALASLDDGRFCATLFDVPGMTHTADEVSVWLADLDLEVTATYGVRAFADFLPRERLGDPEFFEALLSLELAVANRLPYKLVARYAQLIARKGNVQDRS
ncbi:MAG: methyltransferase [Anaerolineae bacterium]|jgi:S-adenosylmethionine-dependent methyltransferase